MIYDNLETMTKETLDTVRDADGPPISLKVKGPKALQGLLLLACARRAFDRCRFAMMSCDRDGGTTEIPSPRMRIKRIIHSL